MPRRTPPTSPGVALIATRYELVRQLRLDGETVDWEAFDNTLGRRVVVQMLRPELAHDGAARERFLQLTRAAARGRPVFGEQVLDAGTDPETGRLFVIREWPARGQSAVQSDTVPLRTRSPLPRADMISTQLINRLHVGQRRALLAALAVVVVAMFGVTVKAGVDRWVAWVNEPAASRSAFGLSQAPAAVVPTSGARASQSTSAPAPAGAPVTGPAGASSAATQAPATRVPTRLVTQIPVASGQARTIANTDGRGVALRAAPGGDRLPGKGYDEGDTVQALEQEGEWTHIRGGDGREGWVLSVTLAP